MENIKPKDLYFTDQNLEYKEDWNSYINNLLNDPEITKTPKIINALYNKKQILENKKLDYDDKKVLVNPLLPGIRGLRGIPEKYVLLAIDTLFPPSLEELDGGKTRTRKTRTRKTNKN